MVLYRWTGHFGCVAGTSAHDQGLSHAEHLLLDVWAGVGRVRGNYGGDHGRYVGHGTADEHVRDQFVREWNLAAGGAAVVWRVVRAGIVVRAAVYDVRVYSVAGRQFVGLYAVY